MFRTAGVGGCGSGARRHSRLTTVAYMWEAFFVYIEVFLSTRGGYQILHLVCDSWALFIERAGASVNLVSVIHLDFLEHCTKCAGSIWRNSLLQLSPSESVVLPEFPNRSHGCMNAIQSVADVCIIVFSEFANYWNWDLIITPFLTYPEVHYSCFSSNLSKTSQLECPCEHWEHMCWWQSASDVQSRHLC